MLWQYISQDQDSRAYRFLVKHFVFPSNRVLQKNSVLRVLRVIKEKFTSARNAERLCVVSFDEMAWQSSPAA